jgi:site-specific DNA-methyltransferase (adenine-specific)
MDTGHGTQKPLECMARPIRNNTAKGEGVYDPFLGSGTTLIACEQLGRICYGQELDEKYMDVIVQRWVNYMNDSGKEYKVLRNGEECIDFE